MVNDNQPQYTVLARRFRPQSFNEVVGQEHVGQAIQNAIRSGRVAHAYLFTGARGVGKTSTARIFAKALNCPHLVDGVPCNECDVCLRIGAGQDVDVLEIDGASNRGIDDIRQLRANVSIRSMRSQYKVYIIDEVHMLTKEAFNALLKTLEEPPPNVKFVFCTTEPNKVPDTILSRCQRFDFGTISQDSISARLQQIAEAEGKQVDEEAIELVARRAAGSMRDSQSLFDQLLAFGGDQITAHDVHQLLGTASDDRLISIVDSLISSTPSAALEVVEQALHEGVQIGSLSDQLLAYLRDLLITAAGANEVTLSAVTESSRERVVSQAQSWGLQTISAAMQILSETKAKMQRVNYGRALFELAIVRMASLEQLDQIARLLQHKGSLPTTSPQTSPASKAGEGGGNRSAAFRESLKKNFEQQKTAAVSAPSVTAVAAPVPTATPPHHPTESASAPAVQAQDHSPESETTGPKLELNEANLAQIWKQLLENVPKSLASHLPNASRQAILGPNVLEILFPKSYVLSMQFCERAEPLKKMGEILQQVTGHPISCRTSIDESAPVVVRKKVSSETENKPQRLQKTVVDHDPYVQMAVTIFSGQVQEVRTLPNEAFIPDSESETPDES